MHIPRLHKLDEIVENRIAWHFIRGREGEYLLRVTVDRRTVSPRMPLGVEIVLELDLSVVELGLGRKMLSSDEEI